MLLPSLSVSIKDLDPHGFSIWVSHSLASPGVTLACVSFLILLHGDALAMFGMLCSNSPFETCSEEGQHVVTAEN